GGAPYVARAGPDAAAVVAKHLPVPRARRMPRLASVRHPVPRRARRHPARRPDGDRRARLGRAWRCRDGAVRRLEDRAPAAARITLDLVADGAIRLALDRSLYS